MRSLKQRGHSHLGGTLHAISNEIDFGSGTRAKERHDALTHMLRDVIRMYKHRRDFQGAQLLIEYMRTIRWLVVDAPHWTIQLEPDEWAALSHGLRTLGTTPATSMLQWLRIHKVEDHGD